MRIAKKSIRTLASNLPSAAHGDRLVPSVVDLDRFAERLRELGMEGMETGDAMVPPAVGKVSAYNAEGREVVRDDLPKETVYRDVYTRTLEWDGPYDQREVYRVISRPFKRFPREQLPPVGLELRMETSADGSQVLMTRPFTFGEEDEQLLHAINLLLELFGECEVLTEELAPVLGPNVRRLNWELLRPGERTTEGIRARLEPVFRDREEGAQQVAEYRLSVAESLNADFVAVGRGGFRGYIVFGFPDRQLYVLESLFHGNATYVFGDDWEELSQLTKTQVLYEGRARERLVHSRGWGNRLRRLIRGPFA